MPTTGIQKMSGKELVPKEIAEIEAPHPEMTQMQARAIGKFAESSVLELTPQQQEILHQPVPVDQILTRPDGMIYLDWGWYANVLDQAFGTGHWSLTPAPWNPKLYREGNITYREYVMWVDGRFAANAIGHHEEKRQTPNFGDAAEATYANALTRCCKRLGVARDLWRKAEIEKLKKQMKSGVKAASPETIEVSNTVPKNVSPEVQKPERRRELIDGATPSTSADIGGGTAKHPPQGAEPAPPSVTSGSVPLFQFAVVEEWKQAIRSVQTLEALKVVWKNIYEHKDSVSPATFEILNDMKDARKKVLQ